MKAVFRNYPPPALSTMIVPKDAANWVVVPPQASAPPVFRQETL